MATGIDFGAGPLSGIAKLDSKGNVVWTRAIAGVFFTAAGPAGEVVLISTGSIDLGNGPLCPKCGLVVVKLAP